MIELEILGAPAGHATLPAREEVRRLCELAAGAAGVRDGHLAIEFVSAARIAELNSSFRGQRESTDVLSFPVDGRERLHSGAARELGDVVICPEQTRDIREAIVHGVLHLVGFDHETDHGEMLRTQRELLRTQRELPAEPARVSASGFVALAGRPNVGKSTFVNRAVGGKVAIVSDRPQTTRRAIRGVCSRGECELVLVDLPGVQRPRDALASRMAERVRLELSGADAALLMLNGEQGAGPGDRFIARALAAGPAPVVVALNKIDRLSRAHTLEALARAGELDADWDVFPISARTGAGVEALLDHLCALMPQGPSLFGEAQASDTKVLLAELVREAVIARTYEELPHAVEVLVEEIERPREGMARVRALIWVESESQKRIVIGARGRLIAAIGTAARKELERELAARVHLDLTVRVRPRWRADEALLDRLGIT